MAPLVKEYVWVRYLFCCRTLHMLGAEAWTRSWKPTTWIQIKVCLSISPLNCVLPVNVRWTVFFLTVPYFLLCVDTIVGTHDAPIRCVEYCPEVNVMVTGSWDRSVRLWDPRTPCNAGTFTQPEKVELTKLCMKHSWANFYMATFIKTKAHSDLILNSDLKLKKIYCSKK